MYCTRKNVSIYNASIKRTACAHAQLLDILSGLIVHLRHIVRPRGSGMGHSRGQGQPQEEIGMVEVMKICTDTRFTLAHD